MSSLVNIRNSLFRPLVLQPPEKFTQLSYTESDYVIYRFIAYSKHLKNRLQLLKILSRSPLLKLNNEQRELMSATVKAGLELVSVATDAKNYLLKKSYFSRCEYPRINNLDVLRELGSFLNYASNALVPMALPVPGVRSEAVLNLNFRARELCGKLAPESAERFEAALEVFAGALMLALGVLVVLAVAVSLLTLNFVTLFMMGALASAAVVVGGMEVKRGHHFFAGTSGKSAACFNEYMQEPGLSDLQCEVSTQLRKG